MQCRKCGCPTELVGVNPTRWLCRICKVGILDLSHAPQLVVRNLEMGSKKYGGRGRYTLKDLLEEVQKREV